MRRKSLLLALLFWSPFAATASAHDFWVQPNTFRVGAGAPASLTLQVGHGAERRRSPIRRDRIVQFVAAGPDGKRVDLLPDLHLGEPSSDAVVSLPIAGTYVLALQTDNRGESHLPADRFNAYLKTEGVTPAAEERARTGRSGAEGSERYSRVAKAIVQVGADGLYGEIIRPLGLPLEIVPEADPGALRPTGILPVRIFYDGRPLAGALLKLTDLAHDEAPLDARRTDKDGQASFSIPKAGAWLLSVVWTRPLPPSASTDFETVFSSLSFAVPAGR